MDVRIVLLMVDFVYLVHCVTTSVPHRQKPNIVFIVADDLGHAGIGYAEGNHQTPTPHIDKLAWDGIILNRHYTSQACTPTRSTLLTSRYTFQTGMQSFVIGQGEPWGVPLSFKLLPQYFKDLNYSTMAFGKWHIGSHTRQYLPNARGFDYWLGYKEGDSAAFNYSTGWLNTGSGRDAYENGVQIPQNCINNHYMPFLLLEKLEQKIHDADPNQPFYIHFASPLPQGATEWDGTNRVAARFTMPEFSSRPAVTSISDAFPGRKKQLAQLQALDEQVRRITLALKNKSILNNTIIVFISDNGPATRTMANLIALHGPNYGSAWPLRMFKNTHFEGGIRNLAFIWSPLLKRRGFMTEQLFHLTDWLPTLYEAAGGNVSDLSSHNVSGVSQWHSLVKANKTGPRREIPINIDVTANRSAIIYQDDAGIVWKLLQGNVYNNSYTGWERTEGTNASDEMKTPTPASIICNTPNNIPYEQTVCQPWISDCLFDLTSDPCEMSNVAALHPNKVDLLQAKRTVWNATSLPSVHQPQDPNADPSLWNGWWTP